MTFNRTAATDHALSALPPSGGEIQVWEVGDHEKPRNGGWQGDPGESDFVPYVVLTAMNSQRPSGPLSDPDGNAIFPFALTCLGSSRRQVQMLADLVRDRMMSLAQTKDADGQTFGGVTVMRYGTVDRIGIEPPLYTTTDTVNVWITK